MSDLNISNVPAVLPSPRAAVSVRAATLDDLPFIDGLQKQHTRQVGWMPTHALDEKLRRGHVIIAEDEAKQGVGYCIGHDQYFKRDDVGIIYQLNVLPAKQRGLIGATLVKAMFERAAYGCRLFCCWCAQDLDANYFWESLGFVPLAFRAGAAGRWARGPMCSARGQTRVHIFWQRRIRAGDVTTPYWFPAKTDGGAMGEDRLVLPIPPGVHWKEPMPILMPEVQVARAGCLPQNRLCLENRKKIAVPQLMPPTRRGARFGPPSANDVPDQVVEKPKPEKKKREKAKADPALVAKARELRDRWLERVNAPGASVLLSHGKYEVARELAGPEAQARRALPALDARIAA
jgi:N-acetylglutamate synthase-like GNAT family acetyltransferase